MEDKFNWYKLKFLESGANLKPLIKTITGREPSTAITREIAVCLQQGRLFYEAAEKAPLEIRPLQLFYGMMNFAKGLVIAKTLKPLSMLPTSHGIRDISAQECRLAALAVKINSEGTFQKFNDVVSAFTRICYFGRSNKPTSTYIPSSSSKELLGFELCLKDIFSRIPGLQDLYRSTFSEDANIYSLVIHFRAEFANYCEVRIDDSELFTNRTTLRLLVEKLRSRIAFLNNWMIESAEQGWGNSIICFGNIDNSSIDDLDENCFIESSGKFRAKFYPLCNINKPRIDIAQVFPPMGQGYSNRHPVVIAPLNGQYLSEFSLHYLGLYLLSSLVRYRPHVWGRALSRTMLQDIPADDTLLALIEQFMELSRSTIPEMIVKALNPFEDSYSTMQ
ncbi:MAG: hypothetical protein A2W61_06225 [Deltaproteobacteria bacterium RIFCSPLOWO2_01_44_7]|nr:MAG: hypothetical protein A2712_01510 [Deltaproteobacteria bacterium RIFCSPHIGHO2_01_FULL_43_49]OGQ15192.1 MAG: hypothetical protein A3D22_03965 [Deltaproteobacteria bacterium RIFCSPHIGHO2_02_FULL_44_53]OGQ27186.1 MAG: hypothetical protein A3D98_02100 [Deltaproteobacteria bacterium RIFCSPHIGHO2_12_FULL_44_21]OGQ31709.1 MAG: hypothetical protein A2979_05125 [Deltaproteobacteria bacterium RIFCSPLOWO2_01_FULL_45_74]OGQ38092.1 MAG: hypothetical protein A2W61_06225 [Deltaproteobacteria bacterium 